MRGLVPGIHVFVRGFIEKDVDGRTSPAMTMNAIQRRCIPHGHLIVTDMISRSTLRVSRLQPSEFGGDDESPPSPFSRIIPLTKRQQTQTVMVNPLLSVVVYFS